MTANLVSLTDPTSPAAEAYRRLRVNLTSAGRGVEHQTLLVAAAGANEDKAVVVANLAVTFARVGKRVILVDCDLRHPAQHVLFGLANDVGVTSVLGDVKADLPLQATDVVGLQVLTSGPAIPVPSDLIASPAMSELVGRLRGDADIVLFDAPPVMLATDAVELATLVDGVLLAVIAGHTKRDDAQRARDVLSKAGARLVGAVLINVPVNLAQHKYLANA
jgi:capsular exopolysaccharide synthesis family protein